MRATPIRASAVAAAALAAGLSGCFGALGPAPCEDDSACPTGQVCDGERCRPAGGQASAASLSLDSGDAQSGPAGLALANALVVKVADAAGAPVRGVTVSWAVASGGGSVSSASTQSGADGKAQVTATLGPAAGANTFTASAKSASGSALAGSPVTFTATGTAGQAVATAFTLTGPTTTAAGAAETYTLTAKDAQGNVAAGYRGSVTFSSSDAAAELPAAYAFTDADAGAHAFQVTWKTAGTQSLTANDGTLSATLGGIAVGPAPVASLRVAGFPTLTTAGAAASIVVTAIDALGEVAKTYAGKVHFSSSDSSAVLPADYQFTTDDVGTHRFSGVTLNTLGADLAITASDVEAPAIAGSQAGIEVVAAPAIASFTASPTRVPLGTSATLTAVFSGGVGSVEPGGLAIASGAPLKITPDAGVTYTLTVKNAAGAAVTATAPIAMSNVFLPAVALNANRAGGTATLLPSGKVLFAGGNSGSTRLVSAELFDPLANGGRGGTTATGRMSVERQDMTATLLPNGKVLIAGGWSNSAALATAEIFDPAGNGGVGSFTPTGNMGALRADHAAALLPNGKVLIAGGQNISGALTTAELFDPAGNGGVGSFSPAGAPSDKHVDGTATLLSTGKVLIAGGSATVELYDPATNSFSTTGGMISSRSMFEATLLPSGKVLFAGGWGSSTAPISASEVYDPAGNGGLGSFSVTGPLSAARYLATAVLLPNGKVLVAGGNGTAGPLATAELYDPTAASGRGAFAPAGSLAAARAAAYGVLLRTGKALIAGGSTVSSSLASCELFDPSGIGGEARYEPTGSLTSARDNHTATLLGNGKVLIAGGMTNGGNSIGAAEIFDPAAYSGAGAFTPTGGLTTARYGAAATLLPNGKVLVAGGYLSGSGVLSSAEVYSPAAAAFGSTGAMNTSHYFGTATLLPNGKVLVVGGGNAGAELYDPAGNGGVGTFTWTGGMSTARSAAIAVLLPNGKVLVAGGDTIGTAEIFDPAANSGAGAFVTTVNLSTPRASPSAVLLPNGKVLVIGGSGSKGPIASAEIFDPAANGGAGAFSPTGDLSTPRQTPLAVLLPNGKVLVTSGVGTSGYPPTGELFDFTANGGVGAFSPTVSLTTPRGWSTATLLPNGTVLIAGGISSSFGFLTSAELYVLE